MKRIIKRLPDIIGILLVFFILALTVLMVSAQTPTVVAKQNDIEVISITYDIQEPSKPQEPITECLGEFRITAYCSCEICCEQYADNRPLDENGNEIVYGAACFTDNKVITSVAVYHILSLLANLFFCPQF